MNQMWQLWTGAVHTKVCDSIIQYANTLPEQDASVGFDTGNRVDEQIRTSTVRWIPPQSSPSIRDLLFQYAENANRNAFGFDLKWINDIQFTTYSADVSAQYGWHHDVWWDNPQPYHRKLSVVVQMTDPSEYEGGRFEFDPSIPQPSEDAFLPKGSVLVFPSFLRHRVTPVTRGIRRSLVSWIEGPKFR
jgi:PKHD-type hydroxylase